LSCADSHHNVERQSAGGRCIVSWLEVLHSNKRAHFTAASKPGRVKGWSVFGAAPSSSNYPRDYPSWPDPTARRLVSTCPGLPVGRLSNPARDQSRGSLRAGLHDCLREIYHIRHHGLFMPRDFHVSPYFSVIRPTLMRTVDYRTLTWAKGRSDCRFVMPLLCSSLAKHLRPGSARRVLGAEGSLETLAVPSGSGEQPDSRRPYIQGRRRSPPGSCAGQAARECLLVNLRQGAILR